MLQLDSSTWKVAPSLHWLESFGLWLHNTPTQKRRERSRLTIQAYLQDVELYARWSEGLTGVPFAPGLLNAADLKTYFSMLELNSKPATYNRKLASIRMLINWARGDGLIDHDPTEWIPFIDAVRKSPRDVSDDERMRLEAAAEAGEDSLIGMRDSLLFFLMSELGLRISEAIGVMLSDLHLDQGYIHVVGKGKKHRDVIIGSSMIVDKIRAWLAIKPDSIEGTLITDENGYAIGREQAWRRFVAIAEKAGVNTTPHAMRSTYVIRYTAAFMQGDPTRLITAIKAACKQTGDTPEVVMAFYAEPRESDMRAAAEAM